MSQSIVSTNYAQSKKMLPNVTGNGKPGTEIYGSLGINECKAVTADETTTPFPGSSLFLPRECTLVAAGHVSARF